ncbi:MAG: 16S rRNA (guanine(527)-N(7))-methyltransferase RsmG [Synergistaceae bacterium]|jgi:16S rRNA (guanine527-N7)-methyltransferase|nr:16S rRNA (guanine(527)-N(7))-methyltransferase RsmG [Synergistaceae bacterium]
MNITEEITDRLHRYSELLSEANKRARLTGPSDPDVIYRELVTDALAALPLLDNFKSGSSFIDVGTGGGLPGLVWGVCRPDMNGVLLDSVRKKTDLLREIADRLAVKNIRVVNARSEDFAAAEREIFDIAAARALAHSCILCEYLSPFVRVGGLLIAFKGPGAEAELDIPADKWQILGIGEPVAETYKTHHDGRRLIIWRKISKCSKRYPRKPGEAKKNPWVNVTSRTYSESR